MMFRNISVGRSFLLFIVASFACLNGNECTAAQPTKVAVGYATISVSSLALWLAQDEKLFAKNDIDADLVFMPGSPTLIAAINHCCRLHRRNGDIGRRGRRGRLQSPRGFARARQP